MQPPALLRGEEANLTILPIVAPGDVHVAPAGFIHRVGQQGPDFAAFPGQGLQGRPAQDPQFRPQGLQQSEIALAHLLTGRADL